MGHMQDLTLESFAYLRLPLFVAALAFLFGAVGTLRAVGQKAVLAAALMMVLFFQAARMALVVFDPYLSSRPLAEALLRSPDGKLIVDKHYYAFSSVFFYANRTALLSERASPELRIRLVRSRSAGRFHRRRAIQGSLADTGAVLPGGKPVSTAAPGEAGRTGEAEHGGREWRQVPGDEPCPLPAQQRGCRSYALRDGTPPISR